MRAIWCRAVNRALPIYKSLAFRLIFWVGLILLISISTWAYYNIKYQKKTAIEHMGIDIDRLGNTIKLGTRYAMMLNSRNDINRIIENIGRQKDIHNIRIYNKRGAIKFSKRTKEIDQLTNIKDQACFICHRSDPPLETVSLAERMRIFHPPEGHRMLGLISPIYNQLNCSKAPCHVHPQGKKVLGLLDVEVSLEDTDKLVGSYEKGIIALTAFVFLATSGIIGFLLLRFVNRPIKKLIEVTRHIGLGEYDHKVHVDRDDEIGQLALAITQMGKKISGKQQELNEQRNEYQNLFEGVPCYITVQDRDLKLLTYNREFAEKFSPRTGDYCYKAYKGRSERCEVCPVLRSFEDGKSHSSEETGVGKDRSKSYWIVRTSPIKNADGKVVAAMEMSLDVTQVRRLEEEVMKSEEKYRTIFKTIPNPVFVLGKTDLQILDCNDSVTQVYGFTKSEILQTSFLDFFIESERDRYMVELKDAISISQARHITKDNKLIFVNIRISPSEYVGREVLLVTTSDITKRLMAEQQLIQAGKLATLGEMATGVAHELNQPLSVMKTASNFIVKKIHKGEQIQEDILKSLAEEIDNNVDRASRIINHMREFGRKSEVEKEEVQVNDALNKALELFSQQLKLREIEVIKELEEDLPTILADANRLEQVFINVLTNARNAIEEKWGQHVHKGGTKKIFLKTSAKDKTVIIEVKDTGTGIPDSILDKIFDPFFTTKRVGGGTGLGLSISYGIVRDYGGSIEVKTKEGEGSTFIVQFPIPDEA